MHMNTDHVDAAVLNCFGSEPTFSRLIRGSATAAGFAASSSARPAVGVAVLAAALGSQMAENYTGSCALEAQIVPSFGV